MQKKFVFRPSVYGFILNENKICICRNKSNGKIWFPGGGINPGESIMSQQMKPCILFYFSMNAKRMKLF